MNVNSISSVNTQAGPAGANQAADSYSRSIQKQIANEQKRLQELSSNQEMTLEEKMKKQQEIQQKISDLNIQLRQHQIEQRKEKQQAKNTSADGAFGGNNDVGAKKAENGGMGLSTAGMAAMISADGSIKQARVQGSVAAQMQGKANVLKAEIKQDAGRGVSVEKKKEEMAEMESRAQAAETASMTTLSDANKTVKEAAEKDSSDRKKTTESRKNEEEKVSVSKEKKESVSGAKNETAKAEDAKNEAEENAAKESAKESFAGTQRGTYPSVDIRL